MAEKIERAERIPTPHNPEAEEAVVGAMVLDGATTVAAIRSAHMTAEEWFCPPARTVIETGLALFSGGKVVDVVTLEEELRRGGRLEEIGGRRYLEDCVDKAAVAAHVAGHLEIIRNKWLARRTIEECRRLAIEAQTAEDPAALIMGAAARFDFAGGAREQKSNREVMVEVREQWAAAAAEMAEKHFVDKTVGLLTPWQNVTRIMGGLRPGVHILAARPSVGKTAAAGQLADFLTEQGHHVAVLTLDVTMRAWLTRALARDIEVSAARLGFGGATQEALFRAEMAIERLAERGLHLNEVDYDWKAALGWLRILAQRGHLDLIVLDHLALVATEDLHPATPENYRVGRIVKAFKRLARELQVPALLLCQLNRASAYENRRPQLHDLRDSGEIEQDAQTVWILSKDVTATKLHPEWREGENEKHRAIWWDLAKNQEGPTGAIPMWLHAEYFTFKEAPPKFGVAFVDGQKAGGDGTDAPRARRGRGGKAREF